MERSFTFSEDEFTLLLCGLSLEIESTLDSIDYYSRYDSDFDRVNAESERNNLAVLKSLYERFLPNGSSFEERFLKGGATDEK